MKTFHNQDELIVVRIKTAINYIAKGEDKNLLTRAKEVLTSLDDILYGSTTHFEYVYSKQKIEELRKTLPAKEAEIAIRELKINSNREQIHVFLASEHKKKFESPLIRSCQRVATKCEKFAGYVAIPDKVLKGMDKICPSLLRRIETALPFLSFFRRFGTIKSCFKMINRCLGVSQEIYVDYSRNKKLVEINYNHTKNKAIAKTKRLGAIALITVWLGTYEYQY